MFGVDASSLLAKKQSDEPVKIQSAKQDIKQESEQDETLLTIGRAWNMYNQLP
jgi:hypothetical protein